MDLIRKYWDIIGGIAAGIGLAYLSNFNLESIQLYYSIIILILVSIGVFRILRQTIDKHRSKKSKERRHNFIDSIVDGQKSIKAISLAQDPSKEGERVGKLFIELLEVNKKTMGKLKTFFSKYKGYISTVLLGLLTIIEQYGGYINTLFGGGFVIGGIEIIPVVTFAITIIVGILSNGFSKEQMEKIKALFSKSTSDEMVKEMIKKSYKDHSQKLALCNKSLSTKETELENLRCELEGLINTLQAKKKMNAMIPQLATADEVNIANNAVVQCETNIKSKQTEIAEIKEQIDALTITIGALKSQL